VTLASCPLVLSRAFCCTELGTESVWQPDTLLQARLLDGFQSKVTPPDKKLWC
jgi:hypothetical protein